MVKGYGGSRFKSQLGQKVGGGGGGGGGWVVGRKTFTYQILSTFLNILYFY